MTNDMTKEDAINKLHTINSSGYSREKDGNPTIKSRSYNLNEILFEDYALIWYKITKIAWKPSFQRYVRTIFNRHLLPHFKRMALTEITKSTLKSFRSDLALLDGTKGRKICNKSINNIMQIMRLVMTEAAEEYGFDNPFDSLKSLKEIKPVIMPLSLEEVFRFLKRVDKDFYNYHVVKIFSGMRTAEVDGLKWKYVDFQNKKIFVRETWQRYQWVTPKTDSSIRDIDMSKIVEEALEKQKMITGDGELVFRNSKKKPLDCDNVAKKIWFPALKEAGLAPRAQRQTRHTAATLWLAAGENPEWVAGQLGHTNTEMLFRVYSKFIPNLTRMDGSAFQKLLETKLPEHRKNKKRRTRARNINHIHMSKHLKSNSGNSCVGTGNSYGQPGKGRQDLHPEASHT